VMVDASFREALQQAVDRLLLVGDADQIDSDASRQQPRWGGDLGDADGYQQAVVSGGVGGKGCAPFGFTTTGGQVGGESIAMVPLAVCIACCIWWRKSWPRRRGGPIGFG